MRSPSWRARFVTRGTTAVLAALVACAGFAIPARADIQSTSGQIEVIAPPPSVRGGALVSTTAIRAFQERADVVLSAAVSIDARDPGTYDATRDLFATGSVKIPAGTAVDSYLMHADTPDGSYALEGTLRFDRPILGILTRASSLNGTDSTLGAIGTLYPSSSPYRGVELGSPDVVILPDQRSVTFSTNVASGVDEIRVITEAVPLVDATLSADRSTIGAGVGTVPVGGIPAGAFTKDAKADDVVSDTGLGKIGLGKIGLGKIGLGKIGLGKIGLGKIGLGKIGLGKIDLAKSALGGVAVTSVPIAYPRGCAQDGDSSDCTGWPGVIAGTALDGQPLQGVSVLDVMRDATARARFETLELIDIDVSKTPLADLPAGALALGDTPLSRLTLVGHPGTTPLEQWCTLLADSSIGVDCRTDLAIDLANPQASDDDVSLVTLALIGVDFARLPLDDVAIARLDGSGDPRIDLTGSPLAAIGLDGADVQGTTLGQVGLGKIGLGKISLADVGLGKIGLGKIDLGAAGLGKIGLGKIGLGKIGLGDVTLAGVTLGSGATPIGLGRVPLANVDLAASGLGAVRLADLDDVNAIVVCGAAFSCTTLGTKTVADAAAAGALQPGTTLWDLWRHTGAATTSGTALRAVTLADVGEHVSGSAVELVDLGELILSLLDPTVIDPGGPYATTVADLVAASADAQAVDLATFLASLTDGQLSATTVAELLALLDDPTVTLDQVLIALLGPTDIPWERLDLHAVPLQNAASPAEPVLTYTTALTLRGTGPADLTVDLTLPVGFVVVPGTTTMDGETVADASVSGRHAVVTLTGVAPGTHSVAVGVRAGLDLGPVRATVDVQATAGAQHGSATAATSVEVVESFELGTSPNDFKQLATDTLYVAHLSSATDTDRYRFEITANQAVGGARASIDLGSLPADYDLVLYGPRGSKPTNTDEEQSSVNDQVLGLSTQDEQAAPDQLEDIPTRSDLGAVLQIAAKRGTDSEHIETGTLLPGTYWVEVQGYNGASSPEPYSLRMQLTTGIQPPACSARTYPFAATAPAPLADPATYPAGVNTLFLVARGRMTATYGTTRVAAVNSALASVAGMGPDVVGQVVDVDGDPAVAAAYAAWAADRCSPWAAQAVADAIGQVVSRIRLARPTIRNVVVVGDDGVIPMARVPDGTAVANESDHAEAVDAQTTNNELVGSVAGGFVLTDNVYGAPRIVDVANTQRWLYVPRLAVGRLVESPEDIAATLNRFHDYGGQLDPMTVAGTQSLVAGYDFLTDGSQAIADALANRTTVSTLISDTWTRQDLASRLLASDAPDVASINAHFDQSRALPAIGNLTGDESDLFTVDDVNNAAAGTLLRRVLFSMGCHSGLSVSDAEIGAPSPDWAQTLTGERQGASWIGNTGYGYGDTELVAYSEQLMTLFAQHLTEDMTIGNALLAAKNDYKQLVQPMSPYDEKVLHEVALYGLPMWKPAVAPAAAPAARLAAAAPVASPPLGVDPITGNPAREVGISLTPSSTSGPSSLHRVDTGNGSYYDVDGHTVQVQYRPVEPLTTRDVSQRDASGNLTATAHGVLITDLTSTDVTGFSPYYAKPIVDLAADERLLGPIGDAVFPASLARVTSSVGPDGADRQTLAVVPGQFRPDGTRRGSGVQRLFTDVQALVQYASPTDRDFRAPRIDRTDGTVVNGNAVFSVETDDTARRVYVLFRDVDSGGSWQGVDLVRTPSTNRWTGGAATSGTRMEYLVQAVDSSGNVGASDNKASNFLATPPSSSNTGNLSVSLAGPGPSQGWFTGAVQATITGPSTVISVSVDGGPYLPYTGPVAVTGDGVHLLEARDDRGNTATKAVPIDVSGPIVTAVASPAPPSGANGWSPDTVTVTVTAADGGGSGVQSLQYGATGATTIASTTVGATSASFPVAGSGTTTVSFSAQDALGQSSATGTLTVKIDRDAPIVGCGSAPTTWSATDVSIACTASDAGAGLASAADASFSLSTSVATGTETANASTGTRDVCDKLLRCATAGPVTGVKVDKKAPTVTISSPVNGATVTAGSSLTLQFACADGGSGMTGGQASCTASVNGGAPVASGTVITVPASGSVAVVVTARDAVGNTATGASTATVGASGYKICLQYDPAQAKNIGSTYAIKLRLCDAAGRNLSSASIPVVATRIDTGTIALPPNFNGSTNLGYAFRYDTNSASYIYNLDTKKIPAGSHTMYFTVSGVVNDAVYKAPFKLK